ncbi:MAG TPA: allantoicase [Flavobacteriales bacterium]|nr:allantoicase [Flavobacteriales bacterium]
MVNEHDFVKLEELSSEVNGGKAIACSDDFFASMDNLCKPGRGIFIEDKFTDKGKWMDGWESRRKRVAGNDWCIVKLGLQGTIAGVDIDTNFFLGNHPHQASLEAINTNGEELVISDDLEWTEILAKTPLEPGSQHFFEITNNSSWTHVRLHIYPDGGVARLKIYGDADPGTARNSDELTDLIARDNEGSVILCNDMFFSHMQNLLKPGRGVDMSDGWETKRNRNPDNVDWVIIKAGKRGLIKKINVDTKHFKGNFPDQCSIEGCTITDEKELENPALEWSEVLPRTRLTADSEHFFEEELVNTGPFTHFRLNIYPDGGVSRLRIFGTK